MKDDEIFIHRLINEYVYNWVCMQVKDGEMCIHPCNCTWLIEYLCRLNVRDYSISNLEYLVIYGKMGI